MAERREEEEGGDGARRWSSGVLIDQGVPRQGKWCLGAVDLALGDSTASGRRRQRRCAGRGVVAARGGVWDACAREEVPRGGQVALRDSPGPFGHRRRTAGGGRNRASREREMEIGAFLRFLKIQGPFGKLKLSPIWRAQMEKC